MPRLHHLLAAGAASVVLTTGAFAQPADDTIVVGLSADINTLDPSAIASRDNSNIARHIFGTLFTMGGDGVARPELANTLEISEDGMAYVYTLNEGLTCPDGRGRSLFLQPRRGSGKRLHRQHARFRLQFHRLPERRSAG